MLYVLSEIWKASFRNQLEPFAEIRQKNIEFHVNEQKIRSLTTFADIEAVQKLKLAQEAIQSALKICRLKFSLTQSILRLLMHIFIDLSEFQSCSTYNEYMVSRGLYDGIMTMVVSIFSLSSK
jgi:hypothetical protein